MLLMKLIRKNDVLENNYEFFNIEEIRACWKLCKSAAYSLGFSLFLLEI